MRVGEASLRNSQGFWIVSSTGWWWKARSKRWSDLSFSFSHRTRSPFPTCPAAWEQHDRPAAGGAPRARPPTQPSAAEIKVSLLAFSWKVLGIFILTSSICFCNPSPCAGKVGFPGTWVALVCVADEENVFLLVNGEADGGADRTLNWVPGDWALIILFPPPESGTLGRSFRDWGFREFGVKKSLE